MELTRAYSILRVTSLAMKEDVLFPATLTHNIVILSD